MKNTYYFTFGQSHPLKNHWIEIKANSEGEARAWMFEMFGKKWGGCYTEIAFSPKYFPGGRIGDIVEL